MTTVTATSIKPCLVFRDRGAEAIKLYISVFKNSKIHNLDLSDGTGPIEKGKLMNGSFELDGQEFVAFDGGEPFSFSEGFSIMVTCETQEDIDHAWAKPTENGGEESPCGWLKDPFGVSWQIIPSELGRMLTDSKFGNSAAATQAMLRMNKLELAALGRAYRG
ncbi:MAG: VOC family protein [Candidatus Dormiibacterota bacterium]